MSGDTMPGTGYSRYRRPGIPEPSGVPGAGVSAPAARDLAREAAAQRALVQALLDPARYPHPVAGVTLLETHISYVLLTGGVAYKIKKAVDLGFLDFSSLDRRRFYCDEELRLNRRLAGPLYQDVVAILGTPAEPRIARAGERGRALEYAVRMTEFPQAALLAERLARGALTAAEIDALADRIAAFHATAPRRAGDGGDAAAQQAWLPLAGSLVPLRAAARSALDRALLDSLERWSRDECLRQRACLAGRRRDGFIRECHGDLHLGNIALVDGQPVPFDCIEFSPELRWIDVIEEMAFPFVDLEAHDRADLA